MSDTKTKSYELLLGNAMDRVSDIPRKSVQTCVTSPPYWGLRDYGDPGQVWPAVEFALHLGGLGVPVTVPAMTAPLGLESTPIAYVAHLVAIFREVWRVLADDGTLWLNIGDTYASDVKGAGGGTGTSTLMMDGREETQRLQTADRSNARAKSIPRRFEHGMKPKDLVGIPWLLAFALRSDGWYLRSDIIWHKRNPMPESVTDRPTKGHEYVFLLAKSARYHCDMGALREGYARPYPDGPSFGGLGNRANTVAAKLSDQDGVRNNSGTGPNAKPSADGMRNARTVWSISIHDDAKAVKIPSMSAELARRSVNGGARPGDIVIDQSAGEVWTIADDGIDVESLVWSIASQPLKDAHFAVMPPELARRCIVAGARPGDTVLDPFAGAATVGKVAIEQGREFVGVELSPEYAKIGIERMDRARVKVGAVTKADAKVGQQVGLFP